MDFRQLETFVEVTKLKSFSKAAEKLFITQPTVTNHIQNLENELGTLLINRFNKNISLTNAGNLLYKYSIDILNTCEMAKFDLASYQGKIQGHLHILSSSVPRKHLLPSIIKDFIKTYPDITFTLGDRDSKEVIRSILDGETDFGILGAKYSSNNIDYIDLMDDRLVLITPNSYKFSDANFSYLNKEILFNENILFREEGSGTRRLIEDVLKNAEIPTTKLKIIAYIEDTETIKELVSLGVGVSFMSENSVKDDLLVDKYKVFFIDELDFSRRFYFAFHKNRQLSPLSETFKNHILNHIKNQKK